MAEIITNADAQYALDIVKTICAEVGPGLPAIPRSANGLLLFKRNWNRTWAPKMLWSRNLPLRRGPS